MCLNGVRLHLGLSNAQTTTTENFISATDCMNEDCSKKTETVQYFDLLGRPRQIVNVKATPLERDIVTPIVYDDQGRKTRSYLPVPQSSSSNGAVYPQTAGMTPYPVADVTNIYSGEKIYTETVLENSPLQRVLQQKTTGNNWDGKAIILGYDVNTAADHVKKYQVTAGWDTAGKLYRNELQYAVAEYAAGQLVKNTVTDEDGHKVVEFKDGSGQTVLSRKIVDAVQNADTYYVYNDYKQLAYVIPPLASAAALNSAAVDNICYQYKYDSRNRLVEKKLPGKGWEYMVYDNQNRLVASQDANLKEKGQWMYVKYDQFGRITFTGIASGGERNTEQELADGIANNNVKISSSVVFNRQGMDVFYDPATTYPHASKWVALLSVNYYDTYPAYSFNPAFPQTILGAAVLKDIPVNGKSSKGLPVMGFVKNIEDDNWTKNYIYYDQKGRTAGSYSINHLGGYTKTESELDFAGLAQRTKVYHKRLNTDTEKVITQTYSYDHQNRLLVHKHKVDNNPEEILSQNTYNELSQITNKKVGGTNGSTPLQSIDYTYNIRGWLTKINDPANLNGKLFGYEIKYNAPANPAQAPAKYNGAISEIDWKTSNDQILRRYDYQYDALNRMKKGIYSEPGSSVPQNNFFNEALNYDQNGNITALQRNGKSTAGMAEMIDNLSYSYTGNQLISVADASYNYKGYPDTSGKTITYDNNGNMTAHQDKGILQINYNFLNLPDYMMFDKMYYTRGLWQNENTYYFYKADGTKHRKEHRYSENSVYRKKTTDYLDGFQYEEVQNVTPYTLKFVPTAEGYYSFQDNKYIYNYKDHLGNVRLSYFNNGNGAEVLEENNYYPFGLKHEGYNVLAGNPAYNYKYNGKELQKETGWLDYGWRQYMPETGKWNGIDQLAEAYTSTSPYAYVANNPVSQFDVDGRWMDDNGHIDTSGNANPFRDMAQSQMRMTQFMGRNPGEGGAGGPAQGPKPNILKQIGNFLGRLFGKSKRAVAGVLTVGAATFEGLAPPVEFGSTVAEIAGYARLGLWSLPLMLNGDSSHASGYDIPLTGAADISGEISKGDNNRNGILLYRGVSSSSHSEIQATMYNEALFGIAIPNGLRPENIHRAHWDMDDHAMSDNISVWTSWTTNKETARYFAKGVSGKSEGVILSKRFKIGVNAIPNVSETGMKMQENEWLIFGPVIRANVEYIKP